MARVCVSWPGVAIVNSFWLLSYVHYIHNKQGLGTVYVFDWENSTFLNPFWYDLICCITSKNTPTWGTCLPSQLQINIVQDFVHDSWTTSQIYPLALIRAWTGMSGKVLVAWKAGQEVVSCVFPWVVFGNTAWEPLFPIFECWTAGWEFFEIFISFLTLNMLREWMPGSFSRKKNAIQYVLLDGLVCELLYFEWVRRMCLMLLRFVWY